MQNFGQINETFKEVLANGIVERNDTHKKIFKTYIKALKENTELKTQFDVFNTIENKIGGSEDFEKSKIFVDECISLLKHLDKNKVNELNNKLVKYLTKNGFTLVENYESKTLHEHIYNLAFANNNAKTINSIVESKLFLNKYFKPITETEKKKGVDSYINHFVGPVMVEKFNSKYLDKLSEIEKKTFKVITKGSEVEKEELYKGTIIECIDLINEKLNEECTIQEKDKYLQVKDKLLRFSYAPDTFVSEMSKIAYLKDTLV